ncbi:hypothetical protein C453_01290 [Haloferax elongans ATCC BAA-1513]|uniref:Uncharacterized protein n=1 Tax=Haloferax elongans ATCC BAA-1513 TaxID=1230453 RepID=M0HYP6_HALEO|nr:hypothetical protein [Haloferax elongans]ELZ88853.1 hypothetical protein C453_01290 [Haloferax elongans ATCC BAA-1513]
MTGMKKGAGEDPFADDSPAESTSTTPQPVQEHPAENDDPAPPQDDERDSQQSQQQFQIPYKFRRDGVQDGRDRVPLFLQKDTKVAERDALHELEDKFEENVSLTDLREALVKVGLQHLDEAEVCLEEWGYGMTFD